MTVSEQHIKIAAQLYDMRDKARSFLGDRYKSHMEELGRVLTMTARMDGKSELQVAIEVCNKRGLDGMDMMLVMAAAVELAEPTP